MIRIAGIKDLQLVLNLDYMGSINSRSRLVKEHIHNASCLVYEFENQIQGYLCFGNSFFEQNFIELLIVGPDHRRKGIGTKLMNAYEQLISTGKVFTSTNFSNKAMQELLKLNNYLESGIIHNLDEDDPEIIYFKLLQIDEETV
jgi:GNAT superfamily N-acetyltransferase